MIEKSRDLVQGQLSVLTLISVFVLPPSVATVARNESWSFCQKCRKQVTAKHICRQREKGGGETDRQTDNQTDRQTETERQRERAASHLLLGDQRSDLMIIWSKCESVTVLR